MQAFGAVPVNFRESQVTTLAISGHKIGGPMGVGALIATRSADMTPVLHGGGQERSVRSGTIDAPAIAGFAEQPRTSQRTWRKRPNVSQPYATNWYRVSKRSSRKHI